MKLKNEDVNGSLELLLELVGEDLYLKIAQMYGGSSIYIQTYESAVRNSRNREIAKRYNGVNAARLASEYRMSANHIKRILKGEDLCVLRCYREELVDATVRAVRLYFCI